MKKTLLILLTIICANIACAQQNPYLDHPNGKALSALEKQSIMTLVTEIMAKSTQHSRAEMEAYGKDIDKHMDYTKGATQMSKMHHDIQILSAAAGMVSAVTSVHSTRSGEATSKFSDKVTLQFVDKHNEMMNLVLGMDPRTGNYVISSVYRGH
jgi:hypothetical protein